MPLPYQPENNDIPVKTPPSVALDALRTIAVSRIYLDSWISSASVFSRVSGVEKKSQPLPSRTRDYGATNQRFPAP